MRKIVVVITLIFVIKLVASCCRCNNEPEIIQLNTLSTELLSNTNSRGEFVNYPTDTLLSTKTGIMLLLSDSLYSEFNDCFCSNFSGFSFTNTSATTCDCYPVYTHEEQLLSIRIISLFDISPELPAYSDVTDHFVIQLPQSLLYTSVNDALRELNTINTSAYPQKRIHLYLKDRIHYSKAQFVLEIELNNGKKLTTTTKQITILQPRD